MKSLLLAALLVPAAFGQFTLYQVDAGGEHAVPAVLDLGPVYPAETASARFRIRNTSTAPAPLTVLAIRGTGFALAGAPALPVGLAAQQDFDFTVVFQSTTVASYSAALDSEGIAVLLTASVLPRLTYQLDTAILSATGLDFGIVQTGAPAASRRITITNLTGMTLPLPAVSVTGNGFSLGQPLAGGSPLSPAGIAQFDVLFQPPGAGAWRGLLVIDDRSYPLSGSAVGPPLPHPLLAIDLADARSGQTGLISAALDTAAQAAGAGSLTLDFQPLPKGAADPAIQLGVLGQSVPFTVAPGDTLIHFGDLASVAFQTGTTAGTISIAVELGGVTDRKSIAIPSAPVSILSAQGAKTGAGIELRVSGFDNTRTAGPVVYTFYDTSGNALAPLQVDNTAEFSSFFAASDAGGAFLLRSAFPVTGDVSKIAEFAVQMTNSAGSAATGRVKF